jgi:hypothetical protein
MMRPLGYDKDNVLFQHAFRRNAGEGMHLPRYPSLVNHVAQR